MKLRLWPRSLFGRLALLLLLVILVSQATADGKTVFAGQHEIEDEQVRRVTLQFLVELARVGQRLGLQALFGQVAHEKIAQARIVVDDKDFGAELFHRIAS